MRVLGHLALVVCSALAFVVVLVPYLAIVLLGAPGFARTANDPAVLRAVIASLEAGCIVCAVGWLAGVLAAFAIWDARPVPRRCVIGSALLALLIEAVLSGTEPSTPIAALIPPIAASAGLVLLIVTGALNRIDPRMLQTATACGAPPARAWLTILAAIRSTLVLTAAAAFSLGSALCTRMLARPALAGLLHRAMRQADIALAPEALALAALSLAPLVLAGLLLLPRRVFRRS